MKAKEVLTKQACNIRTCLLGRGKRLNCPLIGLENHAPYERGQLLLEPQIPCDIRSLNMFHTANVHRIPADSSNPFEYPGPNDFPHVIFVGENEDIGEQRNVDGGRYSVNLRVQNGEHDLQRSGRVFRQLNEPFLSGIFGRLRFLPGPEEHRFPDGGRTS